jgi:hypothetical protein
MPALQLACPVPTNRFLAKLLDVALGTAIPRASLGDGLRHGMAQAGQINFVSLDSRAADVPRSLISHQPHNHVQGSEYSRPSYRGSPPVPRRVASLRWGVWQARAVGHAFYADERALMGHACVP